MIGSNGETRIEGDLDEREPSTLTLLTVSIAVRDYLQSRGRLEHLSGPEVEQLTHWVDVALRSLWDLLQESKAHAAAALSSSAISDFETNLQVLTFIAPSALKWIATDADTNRKTT